MRRSGFTLIEVLVVLAIVGIVLALATVRLGITDRQRVQLAAERLALTLTAARDEAILGGRSLAFSSDGEAYQFWVMGESNWLALTAPDTLRAVRLAEPVRILAMDMDGRSVALGQRLVFDPSGVNSVSRIELGAGEQRRVVVTDVLGRSEVQP